jgi:hypothetical protein
MPAFKQSWPDWQRVYRRVQSQPAAAASFEAAEQQSGRANELNSLAFPGNFALHLNAGAEMCLIKIKWL